MSSTWLQTLVPVAVALLAYFGGRYSVRQNAATTLTTAQIDSNQADRDSLRQERTQLLADLRAEKAALATERDYWRGMALDALGAAEKATDKAAQQITRRTP